MDQAEPNVEITAFGMLRNFGEAAVEHAEALAAKYRKLGETEGFHIWSAVAEHIRKIKQ